MSAKQCTLKTSAAMTGRGLHTGVDCRVTLHPADPNTGVLFITERGEVPANFRYVVETRRETTLRNGDAEVHTVEHLLAAFAGIGVDNVRVEIEGPELPAGDGSALPFVELAENAGIEEQGVIARVFNVKDLIWISEGDKYILAAPGFGLKITELIQFSHPMIGEQAISLIIDPVDFKREIAPARTFCTSDEIEMILSQGLGKGGTEENVVIVYKDRYSVPLRFEDEFARHKALDLIGDLSLIGGRLHADVTGIKTSHALNAAIVRKIGT